MERIELRATGECLARGSKNLLGGFGGVDDDDGHVAEHDLVDGAVGGRPEAVLLGGVEADLVDVADHGEAGGTGEGGDAEG